jgi:hypothetical protein
MELKVFNPQSKKTWGQLLQDYLHSIWFSWTINQRQSWWQHPLLIRSIYDGHWTNLKKDNDQSSANKSKKQKFSKAQKCKITKTLGKSVVYNGGKTAVVQKRKIYFRIKRLTSQQPKISFDENTDQSVRLIPTDDEDSSGASNALDKRSDLRSDSELFSSHKFMLLPFLKCCHYFAHIQF